MISIETYSERGMVLRGDLTAARELIASACPKAMAQEQRGGLVMSRKYEQAIRNALTRMGVIQDEPAVTATVLGPDAEVEADTMPGPWRDAEGKLLA
jgi:hypothetical protein